MFRVEICGSIGSGKTTTAMRLRDLFPRDITAVLEQYRQVLFWEECWSTPGRFELERDISFLLHHHNLISTCTHLTGIICDFSLFEDLVYARLTEEPCDAALFTTIFETLHKR